MAEIQPRITKSYRTDKPLIPIQMISHGTLTVIDIQESRRFYEEVLGFEVIQHGPVGLLIRLGTDHVYVVVEEGEASPMRLLDHNGLDVATNEAVNEAHAKLVEVKEEYGIKRITKAQEQHGSYSFYFEDMNSCWWEILAGREHGYSFAFADPNRDMTDRDDIDPHLMPHVFDDEFIAGLAAKRAQSGKG
ncbi:VOC family protein [Streptomyces sp. NPDC088801]|jgi:catechol 2,3-dioxygenase-like lactoylglutathione lyase family enzyme|uniref:VOC family protein n=1 Tax=Streptomyces sp. NPDC088801 TaxID=3365903 RepID=UPI0037F554DA